MKKLFSLFIGLTVLWGSSAQTVSKRLQDAYRKFENDSQLSHAISSLYIINAKTGAVVFDKNSKIGLAPASTLKLLTAATAYELLGKNFRYKTELAYDGKIENGILKGNIYFTGNGDPTLGSWRWKETSDTALFNKWYQALLQNKIHRLERALVADDRSFETQSISDGWIWQDIGNYYGAGCWALNWKENQYDIRLKSGNRIGDPVEVVSMDLKGRGIVMRNELRSAASGSGDNAYVYLPPYSHIGYLRGTIPVNENNFLISGSVPDAPGFLLADFYKKMEKKSPEFLAGILLVASREKNLPETKRTTISTHYSPPLDSMVYWFLRRSINLYGEAFSKTLAYQKNGFGETNKGVEIIKNFWKEKGIFPNELNIVDGSGLSPINRVTTHAQVMVLKYARSQPWFEGYYNAFPEFNGMKMKSGTISDVKGFCGYHKSKEGNEYIFSFLVNNYNGSSSSVVQKMYTVLNELK